MERKIKGVDGRKAKAEKTQQRAKEAYLEGIIDLGEYKDRTAKAEKTLKELEEERTTYKNELALLRTPTKYSDILDRVLGEIRSAEEEEMRMIVRRWVKAVRFTDDGVEAETPLRVYKAVYRPRCQNGSGKWFTPFGGRLLVPSVMRTKDGCSLSHIEGTVNDVVNTMAWLGGSQIV